LIDYLGKWRKSVALNGEKDEYYENNGRKGREVPTEAADSVYY